MQAVTVVPGTVGSARLDDVPEPRAELGSVVVEALGHESLGRVLDPGPTGLAVGEHVVGIVRRPDPVPCPSCAVGEWDMCSNGRYTERGIKQVHGFMSERWRIEPEYVVRVDRRRSSRQDDDRRSCGQQAGLMLQKTVLSAGAWGFVGAMVLVTGCGEEDDDGDASSAVCDAQAQLDQDVDELQTVDLSATSVDDAEQILSNLGEDVQSLRDAGSDELSPHLDAISTAVDDLGDTISSLGSSASLSDAATAIQQSLGELGDAASDLQTEIADDEDC